MRGFNMVSPGLWRSKRWAALGDDPRLVGLYLLTNEHQSSAGCYRILPGYACADLGSWEVSRYQNALGELEAAEIIVADSDTNEVLIHRWFKHCPPTNDKHFKGTLRLVEAIESDRLRQVAVEALNAAWEARLAEKMAREKSGIVALSPELRRKTQGSR